MQFKPIVSYLLLIVLSVFVLTQCDHFKSPQNNNLAGYTGQITDPQALELKARCHFIPKDTVDLYVARFNKKVMKDSANSWAATHQNQNAVFGKVAHSFNSCIVKQILADSSSIGMRILYGLDEADSLHQMLIGIDKDYNNLYIDRPGCCGADDKHTSLIKPLSPFGKGPGPTGTRSAKGAAEMAL